MFFVEKISSFSDIEEVSIDEYKKRIDKSLSKEDFNKMHPDKIYGTSRAYIKKINGKDAAFFTTNKTFPEEGKRSAVFISIGIAKEFRGKNIFKDVISYIKNTLGVEQIFSSIDRNNINSINAHKKNGFKEISKDRYDFLRKKGLISDNNIRMVLK